MRMTALLLVVLLAAGCSTTEERDDAEAEEAIAESPAQPDTPEPPEGPVEADTPPQPGGEAQDQRVTDHDPREKLPMWSREGLTAQDRMEDLKERADDADPATTPWQETDYEVPEELTEEGDERAGTPGALLGELAESFRLTDALGHDVWEQTTRVFYENDEHVTGIILQWGIKDDAVAGRDFRVRMTRDDDGWFVEEVDQRAHCARGVTDDDLCL